MSRSLCNMRGRVCGSKLTQSKSQHQVVSLVKRQHAILTYACSDFVGPPFLKCAQEGKLRIFSCSLWWKLWNGQSLCLVQEELLKQYAGQEQWIIQDLMRQVRHYRKVSHLAQSLPFWTSHIWNHSYKGSSHSLTQLCWISKQYPPIRSACLHIWCRSQVAAYALNVCATSQIILRRHLPCWVRVLLSSANNLRMSSSAELSTAYKFDQLDLTMQLTLYCKITCLLADGLGRTHNGNGSARGLCWGRNEGTSG